MKLMARYLNTCTSKGMRSEHYTVPYVDEEEDEEDLDDDDIDGYDGLSDFDDDDDISQGRNVRVNLGGVMDGVGSENCEFQRQSDGSANQAELGDDNRRDHHNQLERKRRASIKTSYNDLREVIPSLRGSKASRAVILQRAVECIEELVKINRDHTHCVETLKRQNDALETKVQDLQRYIQRLDGEEMTGGSCCSSFSGCGSATGSGALRLVSGSIMPAGTSGSGSSGVPVYRLLPHDATDKPSTSQGTFAHRQLMHNGISQGSSAASHTLSSRTRTSPAGQSITSTCSLMSGYTGMNALSAAVSLVASSTSAFSSTSSSTGSNCDLPQSSSQRSSPGCLSSSSSTASSFNHCFARRRGQSEERSITVDVPSSQNVDCSELNTITSASSAKLNGTSTVCTNSTPRGASPPSIILNVPVRPLTTTGPSRVSIKSSCCDPDSVPKLSDLSKRRRLS